MKIIFSEINALHLDVLVDNVAGFFLITIFSCDKTRQDVICARVVEAFSWLLLISFDPAG